MECNDAIRKPEFFILWIKTLNERFAWNKFVQKLNVEKVFFEILKFRIHSMLSKFKEKNKSMACKSGGIKKV